MSSERAPDTPGSAAAGQAAAPVGDAVSMFAVGSLVSGYRIEQVLATGATGTVYLATNPTLPRRDALKVLSADLSRDPAFRERFVREADIASLLDHPNIVSIYNRGESDEGHLWIAMQYVEGSDGFGCFLKLRQGRLNFLQQGFKQAFFQCQCLLLRGQNFVFKGFEFGGDEAFGVFQGLAALVDGGGLFGLDFG